MRGRYVTAKQNNLISWKISYSDEIHNVGILVSKLDHCLWDLLVRYKNNELRCEIPIIMSNHADLKYIADQFDIPFQHLPMEVVDDDKAAAKVKQEAKIEEALAKYKVNTLVLVRVFGGGRGRGRDFTHHARALRVFFVNYHHST